MMNLERLRVLDALARHGSVGGAAEALHVTTSAVSQQLAKLEREAGERLLARHGRGVRLTDAGLLLAGHAARILAQAERARAELEARRGAVAGELRVAAFPTAARGLLPGALAALRARHPGLRVRSWEVDPGAAVVGVARGDHDLAVVLDWHDRPLAVPEGLRTASLLDDPAEAALPAGHRLAGAAEIDLAELAGEEWITWGAGEFCHEWLLATLRARGVEPDIAHRAPETHTQLALVAAGLGVCVAPALGREPVPSGVVTVPLRPRVSRHVYAVWRGDADRRPAIGAVVGALRAQGARGGGGVPV
ncbi:LysR family transcriptional regulator [Streptomyces sp. CO7]